MKKIVAITILSFVILVPQISYSEENEPTEQDIKKYEQKIMEYELFILETYNKFCELNMLGNQMKISDMAQKCSPFADELVEAAAGNPKSYAIKRKEEKERIAFSAR